MPQTGGSTPVVEVPVVEGPVVAPEVSLVELELPLSVPAVLVPLVEVVNPDEAVVVLMEVVPVAVNPVVAEELSSPLHARSRERGRTEAARMLRVIIH
ncbi:MAG TPA: hypothetical protein PKW35_20110, partial [Nannocystaceae bacterium]|nr:hypothetical protein [Nannocystaceae bacterium]